MTVQFDRALVAEFKGARQLARDPISTREFYELYAFLDNAAEININAPLPGELAP